ncbi:MAG: hypothetical protein M1820_003440 [Bogoriella megaspora]|nr:MAG: hypothetical protein M1820_003440 [Bogoriella megaspora]
MGTRGLIGFKSKGRRRATYNHFDSYPSGLGADIVKFLLSLTPDQWEKMIEQTNKIHWIRTDENESVEPELQEKYSKLGFSDTTVGKRDLGDVYCLLRNVQGAAALQPILDGTLQHLKDNSDFAKDALFCEWAYYIDFEERTLEVWKGFTDSGEIELRHNLPFNELRPGTMDAIQKEYMDNDSEGEA